MGVVEPLGAMVAVYLHPEHHLGEEARVTGDGSVVPWQGERITWLSLLI